MSDDRLSLTRRTALQSTLASLGISAFLSGSTAAASDSATVGPDIEAASGTTDVIVSLATSPLEELEVSTATELSTTELRDAIHDSQQPTLNRLSETDGVTVNRQFWIGNAIFASIDTNRVDVEQDIAALPDVYAVYDNATVSPPEPVEAAPYESHNDEEPQATYGLGQTNALAAREVFNTDGEGATIAVVDTGIDPDHPAFEDFDADNFAEFTLMAEEVDTDPRDLNDHGTHVSGTVLGNRATDPRGIERDIGVAPDAELLNAKVFSTFDGATSATTAQVVAGVEWAVENGADAVNQSLGSVVDDESVYDDFYLQVMRDTLEAGTLPVASSGNNGQGLTGSPGNVREAFSIGATDAQRNRAGFSSGEQVFVEEAWENNAPDEYPTFYTVPDVAAPGVGVLSSVPGGDYAEFSGTSMSAPHVAGTVGLLTSAVDDLSADEIAAAIEQAAVHPTGPDAEDTRFGVGIIDALGAIAAATDDSSVTGTVESEDDDSLSGFEVTTDFGTRAVTGQDGSYELQLTAGEHEIQFEEFGLVADPETVDIEVGETATVDVTVSPILDVAIQTRQPQPTAMTRGESFEIPLEVANLETLTIGFGPETQNIDADDIAFAIDELDTEFGIDEPVEVDPLTGPVTLTVSILSSAQLAAYAPDGTVESEGLENAFTDWQAGVIDADVLGEAFGAWQSGAEVDTGSSEGDGVLSLEHTFEGRGEELTAPTGPTEVVDGAPASFEIIDATLPAEAGGPDDIDDDPDTITVSAEIENIGDVEGTQDVVYDIANVGAFPSELTVEAGETETFETTISGFIGAGFGGFEFNHGIFTDDDSVVGPLAIPDADGGGDEGGEFLVDDLNAPETVPAGETIEVTATIENTRPERFSSLVEYVFDARASEADAPVTPGFKAVEVNGDSTEEVTFTVDTDGLLPGIYLHSVQTATDSEEAEIVVE